MSFSPKEIALVALLVLLTGGLVRFFGPEKIVYETAELRQQLDSATVAVQTLRITEDQLRDSLEGRNEAFREYVLSHEQDLVAYNRIIGDLNLEIDSLQAASSIAIASLALSAPDSAGHLFRDTTLHSSSTFGDGLIRAEATGGIRNDSLFLDPPTIEQLRPPEIELAQFINDDRTQARAVATSPDFTNLEVVSVTTLEPKKRFPWPEITAVAGFILGYAL